MYSFKLSWEKLDLILRQPFTISRDTKKIVNNILIKLRSNNISGFGEAAPNRRYNENVQKVTSFLQTIPDNFFDRTETLEDLSNKLDDHCTQFKEVKSARAALEMAWLDWFGKKQDQPVWKLWACTSPFGPVTSFTIGLDNISVMQKKVEKAANFPVYKVKLGTDRDRKIIHALRKVTDKPIRVDANEGWSSVSQAAEMIDFLKEQNIEMVEQPMSTDDLASYRELKKESPLPICADESFMGDETIEEIAGAFDIINIKIMKTGSLYKAKDIVERAHNTGLEVMVGCMIESSLANAAGALVGLNADYCDLDGHLLIKNDPFSGVELTASKQVKLSNRPGLGVQKSD